MRELRGKSKFMYACRKAVSNHFLWCMLILCGGMVFCGFGAGSESEFASFGFDSSSFEAEFNSFGKPKSDIAPTAKTGQLLAGEYANAPAKEKRRLLRLAKCANAAYPGYSLPEGYRPFSEDEWLRCKLLRFAGNGQFNKDGYLNYATGLRARLMVHEISGDVVVAWSGCDFPKDLTGSSIDGLTVVRQYLGKLKGQFEQAQKIFQGILATMPGRIEVVGHSLGGALTTYVVAASSDIDDRIVGVTFNGLGLSNAVQAKLTATQRLKAEKLLVNVKGADDPVFKFPKARHYGLVYNVPQDCGRHWLEAHSQDTLIAEMQVLATSESGDFWKDNAL